MSDNSAMKIGFATIVLGVSSLLYQSVVWAEWAIVTNVNSTGQADTLIAQIKNEDDYILEIYRDAVNAIRGKFTLASGLISFADRFCPTFQIDKGPAMNSSINNAPCLSDAIWAEYILGYITDSRIESSQLLGMTHGLSITFRFRLKNDDYRSTHFSLRGSKRALTEAIGSDITVLRSSG